MEILGAQDRLDPRGFGVDAAVTAGVAQERSELGNSQFRGHARGGGGGDQESRASGRSRPPRLSVKAYELRTASRPGFHPVCIIGCGGGQGGYSGVRARACSVLVPVAGQYTTGRKSA